MTFDIQIHTVKGWFTYKCEHLTNRKELHRIKVFLHEDYFIILRKEPPKHWLIEKTNYIIKNAANGAIAINNMMRALDQYLKDIG